MRSRIVGAALVGVLAAATAGAQTLTGQIQDVTVARGDTLTALGARFGVDAATIAGDNGRPINGPLREGETLRIDNRHVVPAIPAGADVVINVPQRMLFAITPGGVVAYPAAVGSAGWQTPVGEFAIVSRETNPTWDVPESIREEARRAGRSLPRTVPPGPNNPLGAHWLGLSRGSVGIHGTNAPGSIYRAGTHGCIRLHPDDIAALFDQVRLGSKVVLLYEPVLIAVSGNDVYVEAHRDVYTRGSPAPLESVRAQACELGVSERIDWEFASQVIQERAGVARLVSR